MKESNAMKGLSRHRSRPRPRGSGLANSGGKLRPFLPDGGIATLAGIMEEEAARALWTAPRAVEGTRRQPLGRTTGRRLAFDSWTIPVRRPHLRGRSGELALPSWEAARLEDCLGQIAVVIVLFVDRFL